MADVLRLLEVFAQPKSLALIARTNLLAIKALRSNRESLVSETAHDLPVFNRERNFVGADFEYCLCSSTDITESWVEETSVVDSELSNQCVVRDHLSREPRWHLHRFARSKNVEICWVKY